MGSVGIFQPLRPGAGPSGLTQLLAERLGHKGDRETALLTWTALFIMLVLGTFGGAVGFLSSPLLVRRLLHIPAALQIESISALKLISLSLPGRDCHHWPGGHPGSRSTLRYPQQAAHPARDFELPCSLYCGSHPSHLACSAGHPADRTHCLLRDSPVLCPPRGSPTQTDGRHSASSVASSAQFRGMDDSLQRGGAGHDVLRSLPGRHQDQYRRCGLLHHSL